MSAAVRPAGARAFDVVVFGATGFTGRLVCKYLGQREAQGLPGRWAVAGRSLSKLNEPGVSSEVGGAGVAPAHVPRIVADSADRASLDAMAAQTRVVLSTVGPFSLYGSELVAACVANGTHYCDITGEVMWVREMIERHHEAAERARCKIVFCCGYDCIPSDLVG
jgi:short subunit dehydrogenase-like uncharacterized protein